MIHRIGLRAGAAGELMAPSRAAADIVDKWQNAPSALFRASVPEMVATDADGRSFELPRQAVEAGRRDGGDAILESIRAAQREGLLAKGEVSLHAPTTTFDYLE